jgi:hypothetical protein
MKIPKRKEMTANAITSKKRARSYTMTATLLQAQTLCPEKGVAPCQGLLLAHAPMLALAQAVAKGVVHAYVGQKLLKPYI